MPGAPLARRKRIVFVLIIALLVILAPLLLAEAAVRLFGSTYTMADLRRQAILYSPSIFTQHTLRREKRVIRDIPHPEAMAIQVNSKGYRGREFAAKKPPGVKRIVVLGGSSTFGYRLKGAGSDWPHRLEARLRAAGLTEVECINAGVPDHTTFDSLGKLYSEIHLYDPDILVLYQGYNDLTYFHRLTREQPLSTLYLPYVDRRDPRYNYTGPVDRVLCCSQLYMKFRTRHVSRRLRRSEERRPAVARFADFTPEALRQFRLNLRLICDLGHNIGAKVLLVTQARMIPPELSKEPPREHWEGVRLAREACVRAYEACDKVLRSVASEKGAAFLNASEVISDRKPYFIDVVHLSPEGADKLAGMVAEKLKPMLVPPSPVNRAHARSPDKGP